MHERNLCNYSRFSDKSFLGPSHRAIHQVYRWKCFFRTCRNFSQYLDNAFYACIGDYVVRHLWMSSGWYVSRRDINGTGTKSQRCGTAIPCLSIMWNEYVSSFLYVAFIGFSFVIAYQFYEKRISKRVRKEFRNVCERRKSRESQVLLCKVLLNLEKLNFILLNGQSSLLKVYWKLQN